MPPPKLKTDVSAAVAAAAVGDMTSGGGYLAVAQQAIDFQRLAEQTALLVDVEVLTRVRLDVRVGRVDDLVRCRRRQVVVRVARRVGRLH